MKVLLVSAFPTHPTNAGNRAWILGQAETLIELGHEVFFLFVLHKSFHAVSVETVSETKKFWRDHYLEYHLSFMDLLRIKFLSFCARFRNGYIRCDDKYPLGLSSYVAKINETEKFDLCIVNYFFLSKLVKDVSFPKTAISTHDCFSYRDLRTKDRGTMSISANDEAKAMQRCDYIFALQNEECAFFQHLSPNSLALNVYGRFIYSPSPIMGNHNLVMLASGINYNVDAIRWFIENVMPNVRNKYPDANFILGGSACKYLQQYSNHSGIKLLGFVENPKDLYDMGDIAVNPVSRGTGLKIKTFESIAFDKVTIVNPHSMTGIFDPEHAPLKVAQSSGEWLSCISDVWENPLLIPSIKNANKDYLLRLHQFVSNNYRQLE